VWRPSNTVKAVPGSRLMLIYGSTDDVNDDAPVRNYIGCPKNLPLQYSVAICVITGIFLAKMLVTILSSVIRLIFIRVLYTP